MLFWQQLTTYLLKYGYALVHLQVIPGAKNVSVFYIFI